MEEKRKAPDPAKVFRAIAMIMSQRGDAKVSLKGVRIQQERKAG